MIIRYFITHCYLGKLLIAVTDKGICRIDFGDTSEVLLRRLKDDFPETALETNDPAFSPAVDQVLAFLEVPQQGLAFPLDMQGTAFQRKVWNTLQSIPPGSTASYKEIAGQISSSKSVRAVANACASNRIAVAIPCHRVVRSNGDLAGYRWGVERKRALLKREARSEK